MSVYLRAYLKGYNEKWKSLTLLISMEEQEPFTASYLQKKAESNIKTPIGNGEFYVKVVSNSRAFIGEERVPFQDILDSWVELEIKAEKYIYKGQCGWKFNLINMTQLKDKLLL